MQETTDSYKEVSSSSLYSEDLAPVPSNKRTWNTWNYAALWISMSLCIPTYMLASSLIGGGMNWWQAILTIFLGNVVVLVPMILNGRAGAKYGIPFPVFARASFGVKGANIPALLRAIVACGWFGIQTWIGGFALYQMFRLWFPSLEMLPRIFPSSFGLATGPAITFFLFWLLNMYVVYLGVESIKKLLVFKAFFLPLAALALLFWAIAASNGLGPILAQPSKFTSSTEFFRFFFPALTGMVGFWATLSLNIPDFTRYAKSQKAQVVGQAIGLPPSMTLFAFIGVAVTSATMIIYGETIWDPVVLAGKFEDKILVSLAMIAVVISTLATNIAANIVSPANDFANLAPKKINFKTGGFITGIIGILIFPWKLIADPGGYIFTWLVGYSSLLGPIGGIMIADYYFIRKQQLNTKDLYQHKGEYRFTNGFNYKAIVALLLGILPNVPGFLTTIKVIAADAVPGWVSGLYNYAWFVGFFISGLSYMLLMQSYKEQLNRTTVKMMNMESSSIEVINNLKRPPSLAPLEGGRGVRSMSILIKNGRIITADADYVADIFIEGETVHSIGKELSMNADKEIDATGRLIFPGGIDPHVHLDMPFMGTFSSDTHETGTRAALFGGTTTVIDFVLQKQGHSLQEALAEWNGRAEGNAIGDYSFHMAVTDFNESTKKEIKTMVEEEGITSFKTFMAYKGALMIDDRQMIGLMEEVKQQGGMVTVHATNGDMIDYLIAKHRGEGKLSPLYHYLSQPEVTEAEASERFADMANYTGCPAYIVHLTCEGALNAVRNATRRNQHVFVETCIQYLLLDASLYEKDFEGAKWVMSPPLREKKDQETLWAGINQGLVNIVATDHCPFMWDQKKMGEKDFSKIPNGHPAIENRMELLYSEGVGKGRISLNKYVEVACTNPAKIFGMFPRKGTIAIGSDADLVIFDPDEKHTLSAKTHHMNVDYSGYEGWELTGKVKTVLLRGQVAIDEEKCLVNKGYGKFIKRRKVSSKI